MSTSSFKNDAKITTVQNTDITHLLFPEKPESTSRNSSEITFYLVWYCSTHISHRK